MRSEQSVDSKFCFAFTIHDDFLPCFKPFLLLPIRINARATVKHKALEILIIIIITMFNTEFNTESNRTNFPLAYKRQISLICTCLNLNMCVYRHGYGCVWMVRIYLGPELGLNQFLLFLFEKMELSIQIGQITTEPNQRNEKTWTNYINPCIIHRIDQ